MAESTNNELLQAFSMFGRSAQQYGLSQAINQANERAQEIKASMQPDLARRGALQDLANDVVARLAAGGAESQQIAAVQHSIAPPQVNNAAQAYLQGRLSGDVALEQAGSDLIQEEANRDLFKIRQQAEIQASSQARLFAQQDRLQNQRLDKQEALTERRAQLQEQLKPPTADQSTAANYAARMQQAETSLASLSQSGITGADLKTASDSRLWGVFQNQPTKQLNQAKQQFVGAILRKESGAAISDAEYMREEQKYFPQPNDGPATIEQKRQARELAIQTFQAQAGKAWDRIQAVLPGTGKPPGTEPSNLNNLKPKVDLKAYIK